MARTAEDFMAFFKRLTPEGRERFICSIDPWYFLTKYVKTHDPYEGIRTFPNYDYLRHSVHALQDNRLNIYQKGRQLTFSWLFSAYGLWESQFQFASTDLYTSKRQEDSFELKERAFFMWENLPPWLRQELTEDNKSTMAFRKNMSKIKYLPATDNVGRTFTAGHIFMDEFAHVTCNAAKMFTSIKPTINSGGRCTIFSSPNGPYGKFYDLCDGDSCPNKGWGIKLKSGFVYHYMPYDVHPGHDSKWEDEAFRGLTKEEIDQEYRALWVKRGGRIFPDFDLRTHVVEPFEIPSTWPRSRGLDFGGANPTATTWIAYAPNGQAIIYREYKRGGLPVRSHSETIKNMSGDELYQLGTISDHDSQNRIEYEDNGIRTVPAIKDWDSGYNEVTRHMQLGPDGKPGLVVFKTCPATIAEFQTYSWQEVDESHRDKPEKPLKLNDHLMDTIRYQLRTTKGKRRGFRPVKTLSGSKLTDNPPEKYILDSTPVKRINRMLVPVFGVGIGDIHFANQTGYQHLKL